MAEELQQQAAMLLAQTGQQQVQVEQQAEPHSVPALQAALASDLEQLAAAAAAVEPGAAGSEPAANPGAPAAAAGGSSSPAGAVSPRGGRSPRSIVLQMMAACGSEQAQQSSFLVATAATAVAGRTLDVRTLDESD